MEMEGQMDFSSLLYSDTSSFFIYILLLASSFIYNSQQSIDETKLNDLSLVINLTKNIQIKAGGKEDDVDPEEYAAYFPALMWVVRDFTLQLVDDQ